MEKLETLSNLPKVTQSERRRTLTGVGCDSGWVLVKIGEPVVEQLESNLVTCCPQGSGVWPLVSSGDIIQHKKIGVGNLKL